LLSLSLLVTLIPESLPVGSLQIHTMTSMQDALRELARLSATVREQGDVIRLLRTQTLQNTFRLENVEGWAHFLPTPPGRRFRMHYSPHVTDHLMEVRERLRQRTAQRLVERQQQEFLRSEPTIHCKNYQ
jgi:hypothetical protein